MSMKGYGILTFFFNLLRFFLHHIVLPCKSRLVLLLARQKTTEVCPDWVGRRCAK